MTVASIVLGAGQGSRLGGPKALLAWPGPDGKDEPLALAHARARRAAESQVVLIVARQVVAEQLAAWPRPPGVEIVDSAAAEALGPAGSIAAAARSLRRRDATSLGSSATRLLVTPVDVPPARPATARLLLAALGAGDGPLAARPRLGRRRGHPVALRAELLERYLAEAPPPLRQLMAELGARVVEVDVDDPAVLVDLDTAGDLRAWARVDARAPAAVRFLSVAPR